MVGPNSRYLSGEMDYVNRFPSIAGRCRIPAVICMLPAGIKMSLERLDGGRLEKLDGWLNTNEGTLVKRLAGTMSAGVKTSAPGLA